MWDNYLIVSRLEANLPKYIVALLLHCTGKDALRLYNGMYMSDDDRKDPVIIIKPFDEHILGETKEFFEIYKFNTCDQKNRTFEQYYSTLRNLERTCGFCNCMRNKLIVDRLILGHNYGPIKDGSCQSSCYLSMC